jgi:hypothetical protein
VTADAERATVFIYQLIDVRDAKWWEVRTEDRLQSRVRVESAVETARTEPGAVRPPQ